MAREHREIFKALNSKILETGSERDERNSLFSSRSKSSRASHQSSLARKADMLTRAAKLETELKFLDAESEKAAELKKIQLMKQLATSQAQIEAVAKLDENHEFDLAVEANLLEPVVSPHECVLAYLENQTTAGHAPVAMETQTTVNRNKMVGLAGKHQRDPKNMSRTTFYFGHVIYKRDQVTNT